MSDKDFNYMKEALAADLAELLNKDFGLSVAESLSTLLNSETYAKLCNPDTGLFFQSTPYVYSFLKAEISMGKIA